MSQIESLQKEVARLKNIIEQKDAELKRPTVEAEVLKFLQKGGYALPDDPLIRETRIGILIEKLENEDTKLKVEGGKIMIVNANGEPKENDLGTRYLLFDELLESKAKITFEKAASDSRKSPANITAQGRSLGDMSHLQTTEDFFKALNEETDPDKQREIKELFDRSMKRQDLLNHISTSST